MVGMLNWQSMVGIDRGQKRQSKTTKRDKVRMVNTKYLRYPVDKETKLSMPDKCLWT